MGEDGQMFSHLSELSRMHTATEGKWIELTTLNAWTQEKSKQYEHTLSLNICLWIYTHWPV